jgi:adenosylhomocysteine nucleosidase
VKKRKSGGRLLIVEGEDFGRRETALLSRESDEVGNERPWATDEQRAGNVEHVVDDPVARVRLPPPLYALVKRYFGEPIVLGNGVTLATGDTFVTDSDVRRELATRAQMVDMEGYSVVVAAQRAGVPVRLIKLVSDEANEESVKTWAETVEAHSRTLSQWISDNLL